MLCGIHVHDVKDITISLDFLEIVITGICCAPTFVEFIVGHDSNFKRLSKWDVTQILMGRTTVESLELK